MAKDNGNAAQSRGTGSVPVKLGARPRGRPQKYSESPALEQQRARVRRAQKAYRSRKEKHVIDLEEKCRELESVVEDMTTTFIAFSDDLLKAVNNTPEITRGLQETMKKFLALSEQAACDAREEIGQSPEQFQEQFMANPVADEATTSSEVFLETNQSQILPQLFPIRRGTSQPILHNHTNHASLGPVMYGTNITEFSNSDPFANNKIWGLPLQSLASDGTSVIPYIVAGRDSFASRLFFDTIVHGLRSLRGEGSPKDASRMFQYKFKHRTPAQIVMVLDGVLDMLLHGTSQKRRGENENNIDEELEELKIKSKIVAEIQNMGGSEEEYLNTWNVERYLRDKWRLSLDSNWVKLQPLRPMMDQDGEQMIPLRGIFDKYELLGPTLIPGFSQPKRVIWDVAGLVGNLARLAVTIGQGPRWHYKDIDVAVEDFLLENRGS